MLNRLQGAFASFQPRVMSEMPESSKKTLQDTLDRLRELVQGVNLRNELKVERQQEKAREHKLEQMLKK